MLRTTAVLGATLLVGLTASAATAGTQPSGTLPPPGPVGAVYGTSDPDTLNGTTVGDVMHGLGGADVLYGRGGADEIYGDAGADRSFGGPGGDKIVTKAGDVANVLSGQGGADHLFPRGKDRVYGGAGADVVRFTDAAAGALVDCGDGRDTLVFNRRHPGVTIRHCEVVRIAR
jgi:Ca2+-binding RTX toxin-like protein